MKIKGIIYLATLVFLILNPVNAQAALLAYQFDGEISFITGSSVGFGGLTEGDNISVVYTFDTTVPGNSDELVSIQTLRVLTSFGTLYSFSARSNRLEITGGQTLMSSSTFYTSFNDFSIGIVNDTRLIDSGTLPFVDIYTVFAELQPYKFDLGLATIGRREDSPPIPGLEDESLASIPQLNEFSIREGSLSFSTFDNPSYGVLVFNISSLTVTPVIDCDEEGGEALIKAIDDANLDIGLDTIRLIGTCTLTQVNNDNTDFLGANALPIITTPIEIVGQGRDETIIKRQDAGPDMRIFEVTETGNLVLSNLTVRGGRLPGGRGAGIFNGGGSVSVIRGTLTENDANVDDNGSGGAIFNAGEDGFLIQATGQLSLFDTTVNANEAAFGAGINNQGVLVVTNSTISNNMAFDASAGPFRKGSGGGIFNSGTLNTTSTITNTTISGNLAEGGRGGPGSGGGIRNFGEMTLLNATLKDNSATESVEFEGGPPSPGVGGGIANSGTVEMRNTILANSPPPFGGDCSGSIMSLGHNMDTDGTCNLFNAGDLPSTDPLLSPLGQFGGSTKTHALLFGSPALDSGDDQACPDTDQRGFPRLRGETCDIGSYEQFAPLDLDNDGDVDRDDLAEILAGRNTDATDSTDSRDQDGDGRITVMDARRLVRFCTRPRCATD